ncbi:MAG: hypothetical protein ACYDHC_08900 [Desulfuromonadaceae bacterium]
MEANNWEGDKTGETTTDFQRSGTSCGCENVKTMIADKLHKVAETLCRKAAGRDESSGMAQYVKQASELLEQSAGYVRQFDYKQTDAKVRDYVRQRPGRSLVVAGAVGLIIGAMLRRR